MRRAWARATLTSARLEPCAEVRGVEVTGGSSVMARMRTTLTLGRPTVWAVVGAGTQAQASRATNVFDACARGRMMSESMFTWCGRVSVHTIASATSSASSGSATPA